MEINEIELLSVGIDVGSSTSHLAFSNLLLKRDETSPTRRFHVVDRKVVYEGEIIDTPLKDHQTIDVEQLTRFFKDEYNRAGIQQDDVKSGAVIITGETAKKQNAEAIAAALSSDAGKFVAATAGPNFESLMAAMGSGAVDRSKKNANTVLSCDIGGGTSNMAISCNGQVVSTSSIAVGGRLLAVDAKRKILRASDAAKKVMTHLGVHYDVGDVIPEEWLEKMTAVLAQTLVEVINGPAVSDLAKDLMVTDDLDFSRKVDGYTFSGGVSELLYRCNGYQHNDIGVYLAAEIKALLPGLPGPVFEPENKIRATVIGAGSHTLSISGSSGFMDDQLSFPMWNVPVLRVDVEQDKLSLAHITSEIEKSYKRFDLSEGADTVALYFKGLTRNSYQKLVLFGKSIESALANSIGKNIPIILIFQADIACGVGNVIRRETGLKKNLLTLDELDLKDGDWIDIGEPLVKNQVFPVTVKSLIFHDTRKT
jgi:ethanolamine utilization protein EutA